MALQSAGRSEWASHVHVCGLGGVARPALIMRKMPIDGKWPNGMESGSPDRPPGRQMQPIARLESRDIRELWKHEGYGFSAWLAENLEPLNEAVGLTLQNPVREKEVGRFSLDLLAETDGGAQVIIENQLGVTNHDHLGKVLTYLSNLEAKIAIWIAGDIREEHAQAIRWLNEFTPADMAFYLVKLSAFSINGSDTAPHFAVVAGPTETGRGVGQEKKELAERQVLRLKFWEQLLESARKQGVMWHAQRAPSKDMWLGAGAGVRAGVSLNYLIWIDQESGVELYIDTGIKDENKQIFDALFARKELVEQAFGAPLDWDRLDDKRACRVRYVMRDGGLKDGKEHWQEIQDAMIKAMDRLARAVRPPLLKAPA